MRSLRGVATDVPTHHLAIIKTPRIQLHWIELRRRRFFGSANWSEFALIANWKRNIKERERRKKLSRRNRGKLHRRSKDDFKSPKTNSCEESLQWSPPKTTAFQGPARRFRKPPSKFANTIQHFIHDKLIRVFSLLHRATAVTPASKAGLACQKYLSVAAPIYNRKKCKYLQDLVATKNTNDTSRPTTKPSTHYIHITEYTTVLIAIPKNKIITLNSTHAHTHTHPGSPSLVLIQCNVELELIVPKIIAIVILWPYGLSVSFLGGGGQFAGVVIAAAVATALQ